MKQTTAPLTASAHRFLPAMLIVATAFAITIFLPRIARGLSCAVNDCQFGEETRTWACISPQAACSCSEEQVPYCTAAPPVYCGTEECQRAEQCACASLPRPPELCKPDYQCVNAACVAVLPRGECGTGNATCSVNADCAPQQNTGW